MRSIIKLDQKTANLIAAGEVVERPTSVVKELVENAIDAEAKNIKILLQNSGITEIVVSDDGIGMSFEDAKMAIEPHATSKIKDSNDLFRITTLGFRGEALPSIASVSHFKMKTSNDGIKGLMYTVKDGKIISEAIIACPRGTEITVRNLFYNTPARLQNLQSQASELSHISDYVMRIAQANPNISFTLKNNNREIFQTYGNNNLREVMLASYGSEVARNLIKIEGRNNYFEIDGYISNLNITRSSKNYINIIANQRPIRNSKIVNAVYLGYKDYLMTGRYPICVININLDPGLIDVNVHPAKIEVRFTNEDELLALITETINNQLRNENLLVAGTAKVDDNNSQVSGYNITEEVFSDFELITAEDLEVFNLSEEKEPLKAESYQGQNYTFFHHEVTIETDENKLPHLTYLAQLFGTYLLCQGDDVFYLIDQHAAAERINYEKILENLKTEDNEYYELLVPFKLDFTTSEAILINEKRAEIEKLGIKIEDFGGNSFMVRVIPTWIPNNNKEGFVEEIITQIINNQKREKHEFLTNLAKDLACKRSIKANEFHNKLEIKHLLDDLAKTENPYTCPHGRPVIIKYTKYEIEKWFKRVV